MFSKGGGKAMATEFDVPFLGSVPIDPMFIRLIEEGKRPVYPEGTVVEGQNMHQNGDVKDSDDAGGLIEKYAQCSLCPIFMGIVRQLVNSTEGSP